MLDTFRGFDDSQPRNVSSIEWQILVIYDQVDRHQNHEMRLA
jgi:hypothetical protein